MNSKQKTGFIEWGMAVVLDKAPRLCISIVIWILSSDTETSAQPLWEGVQEKYWPNKVTSGASISQEKAN